VYNAVVTLEPAAGYVFSPAENMTGAHKAEGSSIMVTHEYDLSLYVPVPVLGAPWRVTSVSTPTMDISITWRRRQFNGGGFPTTDWPEGVWNGPIDNNLGDIYGAEITLTAKPGYTFDPNAVFRYPDYPIGGGVYSDDPSAGRQLFANDKGPIRGYYTYSGFPVGAPLEYKHTSWVWQNGRDGRTTTNSDSDRLTTSPGGQPLSEEEAKTKRFIMVGFDNMQKTAPDNPGPSPNGPADGPRLARITFKRTGIPLYYDYADAPFSAVMGMLQTAKNEKMNFMSITLKERHPDTGKADDPDSAARYSFTTANSPKEVVIDGGGRRLSGDNYFAIFTVRDDVTLTLRNIILDNTGKVGAPVVVVEGGGHLILEDGVVIRGGTQSTDHSGQTVWGGGVRVDAPGRLTMRGGTISGNTVTATASSHWAYGGGVYAGGTFIMEGGAISGNKANGGNSYGGGVYVPSSGFFKKTGGTIYGGEEGDTLDGTVLKNTAGSGGDAVYADAAAGSLQRDTTAGPTVYLDSSAPAINWDKYITLTAGTPAAGTLAKTGQVVWYSFIAAASTNYTLQWEDRTDQAGVSTYTGDIKVSAYRSSNSFSFFEGVDKGYTAPPSFNLGITGGEVLVKVEGRSVSDTGGYQIKYEGPTP
jgi:hypothetical protein